LVAIHEVDTRLQAFQHHSKHLGAFEFGHGGSHLNLSVETGAGFNLECRWRCYEGNTGSEA
jgi:hypothetical protein